MSGTARFDVCGIGNAIVDVVVTISPAFLSAHDLPAGGMVLVDDSTAARLTSSAGSGLQASGGSAANTMAGLASLGAAGAFIGKVRNDALGNTFGADLRSQGVSFTTPALTAGPATARCLVLVTPDAQRTMVTFLGAAVQLGPDDVDPAIVNHSAVTYLEGYLFDPPQAKAAFRRAVELAHAAGQRVALTLSDPFCVARHRDDFLALVELGIDILFANEVEIESLLGTTDAAKIQARLAPHCAITVVTRSERGSVVISADAVHPIAAVHLGKLVDTTGAGDLYAAGFLHGLTHGYSLPRCGTLASLCAAEAISHYGARPKLSLQALADEHGLGAA